VQFDTIKQVTLGLRVAKGVWVGGTSGRSASTQEWTKIDVGSLTITNKRLLFDGAKEDRTVPLTKIISVHNTLTGVEVSVEGCQKAMVFDAANPLIASGRLQRAVSVTRETKSRHADEA
jgi:hypothetical protein